jgi:XTP/dITP diphosphohydrolase
MDLIISSHNAGKVREIAAILSDLPLKVRSLNELGIQEEVEETGGTYAANALLKAQFATVQAGLAAMGDDSGLEVDALQGRPGLYSARYAPTVEERRVRLLGEMKDVPWERRTARFRCAVALTAPGREPRIVEGLCEGLIAFEPKGRGGFGYDPLFYLPEHDCTMAEIGETLKNRISHRGRAVWKARDVLRAWASE